MTDQFRMALTRGQMSLSFILIIKLTARMSAVHKATVSAVHKVTLSSVHETILPAVRIEPIKAVTSLRINIKPMRPTTSILRAHQVYRVSQDYQEAAAHLTA